MYYHYFFMCRRIQFYTMYDFKLLGGHASHNYNELMLRAYLECSVALFIMTYNCGDTCAKLFCFHLKWHDRIKHLMIIKQSGILNAVDCTGRQSLIWTRNRLYCIFWRILEYHKPFGSWLFFSQLIIFHQSVTDFSYSLLF